MSARVGRRRPHRAARIGVGWFHSLAGATERFAEGLQQTRDKKVAFDRPRRLTGAEEIFLKVKKPDNSVDPVWQAALEKSPDWMGCW
jgi:hypothetical protein